MPVRKIALGCIFGGAGVLLVFILLTIALALLFPERTNPSSTPVAPSPNLALTPYRYVTPTFTSRQRTAIVRPTPTSTNRSRSLTVMNGPIGVSFEDMFIAFAFDPLLVNWDEDPKVNGVQHRGTTVNDDSHYINMMWLGPREDYEYVSISLYQPHLMPSRYEEPAHYLVTFLQAVSPGWFEGEAWLLKLLADTRNRERELVTWEEQKEDGSGRVFRFLTSQSSQQLSLAVYRGAQTAVLGPTQTARQQHLQAAVDAANDYIEGLGESNVIQITRSDVIDSCESYQRLNWDPVAWIDLTKRIAETDDPTPTIFLLRMAFFDAVMIGMENATGRAQEGCRLMNAP